MNGKQLGLLLGLLVVLGAAGLLIQHSRNQAISSEAPGGGGKLLGTNFPINDVGAFEIRQGTNVLNLSQKEGDVWRVGERSNYPAAFPQISELLVKTRDLKIVESDEISPADLASLQLAPAGQGTNSGVELVLKGKNGKIIQSVTLGKPHVKKPAQRTPGGDSEGFADGRYVMLASDPKTALLVSDPLSEVEPRPEAWLNKEFFKVDRPRVVSVSYPDATNSWKIDRTNEASAWNFKNPEAGEEPDTNKLTGVGTPFASPSFEDVLVATKAEDTGLDKPTVVTVETFEDFTYVVKIGKKIGENYPLTVGVSAAFPKERTSEPGEKPEDKDKADKAWQEQQNALKEKLKQAKALDGWIYSVPAWNLDTILKNRKELMADKKVEAKPGDPTSAPVEKKDTAAPDAPK